MTQTPGSPAGRQAAESPGGGTPPGTARWWLADLQHDQVPGHHLVRAPDRRRALASFRADMIQHFHWHNSRRWATDKVRAMEPVIVAGPLTPEQAFSHALGWAWAWEITRHDRGRTTVMCEPASPASRETAERELGPALTQLIERDVAAAYLQNPASTTAADSGSPPPAACRP